MSTATAVMPSPSLGASSGGPKARGAEGGRGEPAENFAGLLFSHLDRSRQDPGEAQRGQSLPAPGESLPKEKTAAAGKDRQAAGDEAERGAASKAENGDAEAGSSATDSAGKAQQAAEEKAADKKAADNEAADKEAAEVALNRAEAEKEQSAGESRAIADAKAEAAAGETEAAGKAAADAEMTAEAGKEPGGDAVDRSAESLSDEQQRTEAQSRAAEGEVKEAAALDDEAARSQKEQSEAARADGRASLAADEAAKPVAESEATVPAGAEPKSRDSSRRDAVSANVTEAAPGDERAVSAEADRISSTATAATTSGSEATAQRGETAAASARLQGDNGGTNQAREAQAREAQARAADVAASSEAEAEADSEGESSDSRRDRAARELAQGEMAAGRQRDGAGKGEFVLPGAKELTFENPFRSLGLGLGTTARAESTAPGAAPSLAQLQQAYQGSATAPVSLSVAERFGSQQWGGGMTQRILWMANQQVGRAEIRLDPPELGSLTVRLNISQEQASVSFVSPHAHVRDALEQQMPRLREMLAENGLNLEQADVSDQSLGREAGEGGEQQGAGGGRGNGNGESGLEAESVVEHRPEASLRLVDFYA